MVAYVISDFTHPFGVALGKIIVYGNDVDAVAGKRVEIRRQSGHQRFSFAGAHFGYSSLMKRYSAEYLYVEVAHAEHARAGFTDGCERFRQKVVERLVILAQPAAEFFRFGF